MSSRCYCIYSYCNNNAMWVCVCVCAKCRAMKKSTMHKFVFVCFLCAFHASILKKNLLSFFFLQFLMYEFNLEIACVYSCYFLMFFSLRKCINCIHIGVVMWKSLTWESVLCIIIIHLCVTHWFFFHFLNWPFSFVAPQLVHNVVVRMSNIFLSAHCV